MDAVRKLRPTIRAAIARGHSLKELHVLLERAGVHLSMNTLKSYIYMDKNESREAKLMSVEEVLRNPGHSGHSDISVRHDDYLSD